MNYPKKWKKEEGRLERVFEFKNFLEAFEFVKRVVPLAEEENHHPDLEIFGYNKVRIGLTTHEEKRVTKKDTSLAKKIDEIFKNL